jgi:hypothetical protein
MLLLPGQSSVGRMALLPQLLDAFLVRSAGMTLQITWLDYMTTNMTLIIPVKMGQIPIMKYTGK